MLPLHHHGQVKRRVLCCYGIDVDAVAGWLGSYGGEDSPCDISRGIFAATVGVPRILAFLAQNRIRATFFVPGHTLASFPHICTQIRDAGHEIGLHGYSHENPSRMTPTQQRDVLDATYRQLTAFVGRPPRGSVAPWWEMSSSGAELLLDYGIEYDHSMMHHDCEAYYLRLGDSWTKIDYSLPASSWMHPLKRGEPSGLVEIPACWNLDDLPAHLFVKSSPRAAGWRDARELERVWRDYFDYFYATCEEFVFPLTIHPDVSAQPHMLLMHQRFVEYVNQHEGVEWMAMEDVCDVFKERVGPEEGARRPADKKDVIMRLAEVKRE